MKYGGYNGNDGCFVIGKGKSDLDLVNYFKIKIFGYFFVFIKIKVCFSSKILSFQKTQRTVLSRKKNLVYIMKLKTFRIIDLNSIEDSMHLFNAF